MASAANDSRFDSAKFTHQIEAAVGCATFSLRQVMAGNEATGKAPKPYSFKSLVTFRLVDEN